MSTDGFLRSLHKNEGWQGQYKRMIRWFNKFKDTDPGNLENLEIHIEHDIMYACFQNIFFLKDWLRHDAKISDKVIHKHIAAHIELQLCRDICNGTKHFKLTNASVDDSFAIIREFVPFHNVFGTNQYRLVILSGTKNFELKWLAMRCIVLWDTFIKSEIAK